MVLDSFYQYIDGSQEQLRASHPGQGYWELPGSLSVAHSLALYLGLLKKPWCRMASTWWAFSNPALLMPWPQCLYCHGLSYALQDTNSTPSFFLPIRCQSCMPTPDHWIPQILPIILWELEPQCLHLAMVSSASTLTIFPCDPALLLKNRDSIWDAQSGLSWSCLCSTSAQELTSVRLNDLKPSYSVQVRSLQVVVVTFCSPLFYFIFYKGTRRILSVVLDI